MLSTNNFFKSFNFKSNKINKNIIKTKKIFENFKLDLENYEIPLLQSYKKNYNFDFTTATVKRFSKYNNIIIVGMGGSILGTKCIYSFFRNKVKKKVFFFDNLDHYLYSQFSKIKNLKNSCFVIVSKSGKTLETITNLNILFSKISLKNKLVFITEIKDSYLNNLSNQLNSEIIEHKDFIGGRYSVLSEVGMFPAALMGIDINKFRNLEKLLKNKKFTSSLIKNVASIYTLNMQGIKSSVILNYDSRLNDLGLWYQQLVGESLGKKGKGITTILSPVPKDNHSTLQLYLDGPKDKFFTFLTSVSNTVEKIKISKEIISKDINYLNNKSLQTIISAQHKATKNVFKSKKIPFREFYFNKNNEEELGMIFTFLVLETIILAYLMNVNPFDQPAVEQVKTETKKILLR